MVDDFCLMMFTTYDVISLSVGLKKALEILNLESKSRLPENNANFFVITKGAKVNE